jgi:hypothetical protein
MEQAARAAMPGAAVVDAAWLTEYDAYYYAKKDERPLPVLRVRFADPDATWLYVDPSRGAIALNHGRVSRAERWLYHGLHSLDFPGFYQSGRLWDVVLILLSIGGTALSVTTLLPAWRRLRRHATRYRTIQSASSPSAVPSSQRAGRKNVIIRPATTTVVQSASEMAPLARAASGSGSPGPSAAMRRNTSR